MSELYYVRILGPAKPPNPTGLKAAVQHCRRGPTQYEAWPVGPDVTPDPVPCPKCGADMLSVPDIVKWTGKVKGMEGEHTVPVVDGWNAPTCPRCVPHPAA